MAEDKNKKKVNSCLIALHAWDWPTPTNFSDMEEIINLYMKEKMGNALCIWPDHQPARFEMPVSQIDEYDLDVVLYFFTENIYNWMQSLTWSNGRQDRMEEYVRHWVDAVVDLAKKRPDKVWWSLGHEHMDEFTAYGDSNPQEGIVKGKKFKSKQEGYDFYSDWLNTDLHKTHWSGGHIQQAKNDRVYKYKVDKDIPPVKYALGNDIGIEVTYQYIKNRSIDTSNILTGAGGTVAATAAYLFSLSDLYKFFWWECSYCGTGLQPGIAFVRGAAKQYGRKWLMDHSPYSNTVTPTYKGPNAFELDGLGLNSTIFAVGKTTLNKDKSLALGTKHAELNDSEIVQRSFWWPQYDWDGNRLSGISEYSMLRDWLWSYMSGADCIFQEASAASHFIKKGDEKTGTVRVTPAGEAAKKFYSFVEKSCQDRGETVIPIALFMDFYHGMDPGPSSLIFRHGDCTWGSIPFTEGDYMANEFFEMAFPGQGSFPKEAKPWKDIEEYARLSRAGLDIRPYEKRTVTTSRWGDIFDVVLDNADPSCLYVYSSVLILGDIKLTEAWMKEFEAYISKGGRVLLNIAQLEQVKWPEWFGCEKKEDFPVLTIKKHEMGEVWLCKQEYLVSQDPENGKYLLSESGKDILDSFITSQVPVKIMGDPLGHIVNKRDNGDLIITLINPCESQWLGRIIVPEMANSEGLARDIWNDRIVMNETIADNLILEPILPPWGVMVIEIKFSKNKNG